MKRPISQTARDRALAEIIAFRKMSLARSHRTAFADMSPTLIKRLALKREKYFAKNTDLPRRLAEKVWARTELINVVITYIHKRQKVIDDYEAQR